MKIRGRYYGAASRRPVFKAINTQTNSGGRSPRLDLLLSDNKLQPFIHDAIVVVVTRRTTSRFHVFVKNHRKLQLNGVVQRWNNGLSWRGDIVALKKGRVHEIVNLSRRDVLLADFAVKQ